MAASSAGPARTSTGWPGRNLKPNVQGRLQHPPRVVMDGHGCEKEEVRELLEQPGSAAADAADARAGSAVGGEKGLNMFFHICRWMENRVRGFDSRRFRRGMLLERNWLLATSGTQVGLGFCTPPWREPVCIRRPWRLERRRAFLPSCGVPSSPGLCPGPPSRHTS